MNWILKKKNYDYCTFVIDIMAPQGTTIYAVADGKVEENKYGKSGGNYVVLSHDDGSYSYYGHMNRQSSLSVGSWIKQGDVIGYVGMTGAASGYHLHFEWSKHDPYLMYSSLGYVKIGSAYPGLKNYISKHASNPSYSFLQTFESPVKMRTNRDKVAARTGPYEHDPKVSSAGNDGELPLNTVVTVVASIKNIYGNLWYRTQEGYWIYGERLGELPVATVKYNVTKSANKKKQAKKLTPQRRPWSK